MISLIICTRNRGKSLRASLDRLGDLAQPGGGWELILIDNGSTDDTSAIIESYRVHSPAIVAREDRAGLPHARNLGVSLAGGEIVAFTDDDCYVSRDFLPGIERRFADPDLGYLGGGIHLHDPSDAPVGITGLDSSRLIAPRSFVPPGLIQGSNFACRRRALVEAGGFDPDLGPGTPFNCEEVECLSRISAAGWTGGFFPEIVVFHHHGRKAGSPELSRLIRSYARGRGSYYAKLFLEGRLPSDEAKGLARHLCRGLLSRNPSETSVEFFGAAQYLVYRLARWTRSAPTRGTVASEGTGGQIKKSDALEDVSD